jgi:class 3 adenylate cyclase
LFCDLSSSSSLFKVLHESGAVTCINDYLSQVTDIVLSVGGSIDTYLGDGAMFRFVDTVLPNAELGSIAVRSAAEAALKATAAFGRIKQSWLDSRWEAQHVFSRMGIAYGPFRETLMGPERYRERVVLGASVHRAAQICDVAPRDRSVILVDRNSANFLRPDWKLSDFASSPSLGVFELMHPMTQR